MKRSAISVLVFALAQIVIQPRAIGTGIPARFTGGANPQCWIASAHLKNIDSHLPNPSASYVIQGRCETYEKWITFDKQKKYESTFETGPVDSQIDWTAQGTYQPVEKNTWEDITLTQRRNDKTPTSGVLTGWMLCGKDPWLKGDPSACGAPGFKTSGVVDPMLAELYKQSLIIPLTAHLSDSQRKTLNDEYQAAVQAATKKANEVKVVALQSTDKLAQSFVFGAAPKVSPTAPASYPPYGATYTPNAVPGMKANQTLTIPVKVMNGSSTTWPANGIYRLAYHWKSGGGYAVYDGARTFLPTAVVSGNTIALNAKLVAPGAPGTYVLQWDLVQEGITWFSTKGVPTKDQTVTVTP